MDFIKQDADIILMSGNSLEEFNFNNVIMIYVYSGSSEWLYKRVLPSNLKPKFVFLFFWLSTIITLNVTDSLIMRSLQNKTDKHYHLTLQIRFHKNLKCKNGEELSPRKG